MVSLRYFAAVVEYKYKTSGVDPALNNILWGNTRNISIDEFGQLRPFRDLIFNHRLNILHFLLSTILPLDIFCWATEEVVGSVFFRDDVSTPGPGTTNLCCKTLNFGLNLCSLDPVSPGFQLLPLLLQVDDLWIWGKYYKNVIRYIN